MSKWLVRPLLLALLLCGLAAGSAQARALTWSQTGQLVQSEPVEALACPSATSCTALLYRGDAAAEDTFSPTDPARHSEDGVDDTAYVGQLACPSTRLCLFGDIQGIITSFDPADPADRQTWQATDSQIEALACPSTAECVLVATDGGEQTFDPADLGAAETTGQVVSGANWLSCPSAAQCTVVGVNGAETFNPQLPPQQADSAAAGVDGGTALLGLSCPSSTICVAVDYDANALSFDPGSIGTPTPQMTGAVEAGAVGEPGQPLSISCRSTTDCVVVSESGDAYEGNPQTGDWVPEAIRDDGLAAIACPTAGLCVSADLISRIFIGTEIPSGIGAGLGFLHGGVSAQGEGYVVHLGCAGSATDRCVFTVRLAASGANSMTSTKTVTAKVGPSDVAIGLSRAATRALASHHRLAVRLTVTQKRTGFTATVLNRLSTLHAVTR